MELLLDSELDLDDEALAIVKAQVESKARAPRLRPDAPSLFFSLRALRVLSG